MGKTQNTGRLTNGIFQDSSNNIAIGDSTASGYKFKVTGTSNLNGALSGTSASFSGTITSGTGSGNTLSSGSIDVGKDIGLAATQGIVVNNARVLAFASTGATTFSSSVSIGTNNTSTLLNVNIPPSTTNGLSLIDGSTVPAAFTYSSVTGENRIGGLLSYVFPTFYSGGSERMKITTSGNVGIGTSSPNLSTSGTALTVNAASNANAAVEISDGGTLAGLIFGKSGNSVNLWSIPAIPLIFGAGNTERMRITSGGYLKASPNGSYFSSTGLFSEFGNNTTNTPALFLTQTNTSFTDNVLFIEGYTNTTNNTWYLISGYNRTAGAYKFRVADSGNVTNTNNSYGAISDIKLKENIVDASPKLNDLLKVKIKNFNYIGSEEKQLGVIAQELEEVFPSMIEVHNDKDGEGNDLGSTTKSVKYSVFVPMLIKAIQEQQAEIEELKALIAAK